MRTCNRVSKFNTFKGIQFCRCTIGTTILSHYRLGICAPSKRAQAIPKICSFFCLTIPLCCDVWRFHGEDHEFGSKHKIPDYYIHHHCLKEEFELLLKIEF